MNPKRTVHRRFQFGSDAASSVFGILIGTATVSMAFAGLITYTSTQSAPNAQPGDQAELDLDADFLLDWILQPGTGWYPTGGCASGQWVAATLAPDRVQRLGLGEDPCKSGVVRQSNVLGLTKMRSVQNALNHDTNDTNQKVDYPDARKSLGLSQTGLQFHLETEPALVGGQNQLQQGWVDPTLRTAYVGNWLRQVCLRVPNGNLVNCAETPDPPQGEVPMNAPGVCGVGACLVEVWRPNTDDLRETEFLTRIVKQFTPNVGNASFDHSDQPYQLGGDVFPDRLQTLPVDLCNALESPPGTSSLGTYNVVVIGSNVNPADVNPTAAACILKWARSGGYLILLGNANPVTWTNGANSANASLAVSALGRPGTFDVDQPLLTQPWGLDWGSYENPKKAWETSQVQVGPDLESRDDYVDAVYDASGSVNATRQDAAKDFLGTSRLDHFGSGRIVVSSYQPWDLYAGGPPLEPADCERNNSYESNCEGVRFLRNLFWNSYDDVTIHYGPSVPEDRATATSHRLATVNHPYLGDYIEVHARLTVWREGPNWYETPLTCKTGFPATLTYALTASDQGSVTREVEAKSCADGKKVVPTLINYPTTQTWNIDITITHPDGSTTTCDGWSYNPVFNPPLSTPSCETPAKDSGWWTISARIGFNSGALGGTFEIRSSLP